MSNYRKKQGRLNSGFGHQAKKADALDDLAAFEQFQDEVLPMLRKAVKEGWPPQKIYQMAAAHAAARGVTIALTEVDSGKALTGIKEILDRSGGKATERKEIKHEISQLSEDELDALIQSQQDDSKPTTSRH